MGGNRSTRRKPLATSFRKCDTLPEDSSPKRDTNPRSSICGRLGKTDMLTVTTHVGEKTRKIIGRKADGKNKRKKITTEGENLK